MQRSCYQRESPCQDPAGNWTTRRSLDDRKETQTEVVWSCFPFIRCGQNHLARCSERGKKTRQTEEEVGRQHQGMDSPGVRQAPEGSGEQGKHGENWLKNHLWCPNGPRGKGSDDDDDDGDDWYSSLPPLPLVPNQPYEVAVDVKQHASDSEALLCSLQRLRWGCSSAGRASDRHAAEAGSIPQVRQGIFLSESNFQCRLSYGVRKPPVCNREH